MTPKEFWLAVSGVMAVTAFLFLVTTVVYVNLFRERDASYETSCRTMRTFFLDHCAWSLAASNNSCYAIKNITLERMCAASKTMMSAACPLQWTALERAAEEAGSSPHTSENQHHDAARRNVLLALVVFLIGAVAGWLTHLPLRGQLSVDALRHVA